MLWRVWLMNSLMNKFRLTKIQKKILQLLVSRIEKSKTYAGTNKVNQNFYCKPDEIYDMYYSDYADLDKIEKLNVETEELKKYGLIRIKYDGREISKITGLFDKYTEYCDLLGIDSRNDIIESYRAVINKYSGQSETVDNYCRSLCDAFENNKIPAGFNSSEELDKCLECIKYIENNNTEIMERELSIELFSDSKIFEKKYQAKVCRILKNFGNYSSIIDEQTDAKTINKMLLAENNIVSNPTYIHFKGNGKIKFRDGTIMTLSYAHPTAVNSQDIRNISVINIDMNTVITVENLTSYNRLRSEKDFIIYLSGYNNTAKSEFLKQIAKDNMIENWYHFGDIDPDGFYILENLKKSSGLDIKPYKMNTEELEKYSKYTKTLEKQDITKANSLKEKGLYADVITYMLKNNCKLEQEIISWKEPEIS